MAIHTMRRTAAAIGILTGAIVLFFWKIVFTHQFDWIWGPDLAQQVLPWFEIEARMVHGGHLPLWDPSFWCGQPLLGQMQPGAAFPLNWMLFALPLDAAGHIARASLEWYFVIIHALAAVFAFLLCRDLGRSRGASVIAGMFFALGGYIGHTGWPQMLNGAIWAPLVLLFVLRIMRAYRPALSGVWAGVFLGFAWLSGHHEAPLYLSFMALFLCLWRRAFGPAIVLFTFAFGVGALQILPAYEYGRLATRFGAPGGFQWNQFVPYAVHAMYSLSPAGIAGILFPTLRSDLVVFAGVIALALGIAGALENWSVESVRVASVTAIAGLLYALGGSNVIQGAVYAVLPQLNRARHPESAILIFDVGLAVLVAFGVDSLGAVAARLTKVLGAFGVAGLGVISALSMADLLKADPLVAMAPFVALLFAALLWASSRGLKSTAVMVSMGLLLAIELGSPLAYYIVDKGDRSRTVFLERMESNQDVAAFLKRQPGPFRILSESPDVPANWAGMNGLETIHGYLGGVTNNIIKFDTDNPKNQQMLGVRYRIGTEPPKVVPAVEVFRGGSGLRVYRDDAAFPRAWMEYEGPCAGDEVRYRDGNAQVKTGCGGTLVISETWFPGWRAWVDGKATSVLQVHGALQGVAVPAGAHTIEVRYRPLSVIVGACGTAAFVVAAAVLGVLTV